MVDFIIGLAKTARPRQWIKNFSIFAALVFTGQFYNGELFDKTVSGFIALSLVVSSVYFINDIADVSSDRLHPFKKFRPIASGRLPVSVALLVALLAASFGLYQAYALSSFFFYALVVYLILQLAYTFFLKEMVVIDILAIATGFVLRVYAGAFLIDAHLSVWFLLCVISVSLFLAASKRRAELFILQEKASQHRKTLSLYSTDLLDSYLAMFATASWLSWALFTFFKEDEQGDFYIGDAVAPQFLDILPLTILGSGKLLMVTIPVVIFGIMRYLRIVYEGSRAETPERVLMTDKPLVVAFAIWTLLIFLVLYVLKPGVV